MWEPFGTFSQDVVADETDAELTVIERTVHSRGRDWGVAGGSDKPGQIGQVSRGGRGNEGGVSRACERSVRAASFTLETGRCEKCLRRPHGFGRWVAIASALVTPKRGAEQASASARPAGASDSLRSLALPKWWARWLPFTQSIYCVRQG